MKNQIIITLFFITLLVALRSTSAVEQQTAQTTDAAKALKQQEARKDFSGRLVKTSPRPHEQKEVEVPADSIEVEYTFGPFHLKAWVNKPPAKEKYKYPAMLLLHGGNTFEVDDAEIFFVAYRYGQSAA